MAAGGVQAGVQGAGSGYYRGDPPRYGGIGSMAGPAGAGTATRRAAAGWTPTVANLMVLVLVEFAAYAALRWAFKTAHGG
jgi:hypothetical protein